MKSKILYVGLIATSLFASVGSADCEYFHNDDGSYAGSVCTDADGNSTQTDSAGIIMSGWGNGQHYSVEKKDVDGTDGHYTLSYTHSKMDGEGKLSDTYTGGYLYVDNNGNTTQYGSNNEGDCGNWHCEINNP